MKVAIVNLTSGGLSGGYRKYLQRLIPLLKTRSNTDELSVYVPRQSKDSVAIEDTAVRSWPDSSNYFSWLISDIGKLDPDVVFIPTARWIDVGVPTVVMVRNMEPLTVPFGGNRPMEVLKNLARRSVAKKACRHATRIIAVSQWVRDFLTEEWRIPESKVGLVYHGIDTPSDKRAAKKPDFASDNARFIFTAGSIRPARGLEDIIRALPLLTGGLERYSLVIAGNPDPATLAHAASLERLVVSLKISNRIIWAGHLSPSEMSWCYYNCSAFVMTSRAEACPNIALEAMSHGCNLISTTQAPMPEFFVSSALYYTPKDSKSLVSQIMTAINETQSQRDERKKLALARAAEFKWSETARQTVDQLEIACSSGK